MTGDAAGIGVTGAPVKENSRARISLGLRSRASLKRPTEPPPP